MTGRWIMLGLLDVFFSQVVALCDSERNTVRLMQCDIAPCWKRFGGVHSSDMAVTQIMERLLLEGFPKNTAEFRAVLSGGVQLQLVRVMM